MKFKAKPIPKEGDTRERTVFPIIPMRLGDTIYWLEKVTIKEKYTQLFDYDKLIYYSWVLDH